MLVLAFDVVLIAFLSDDAGAIVNRYSPVQTAVQNLRFEVVEVQQYLTDISATRGLNGLDDGFKKAEEHARAFYALVDNLKQLDPEHRPDLDALRAAFDPFYETGKKMAHSYQQGGPETGNAFMVEFDTTADKLVNVLDALIESADDGLTEHLVAQQQSQQRSRAAILTSALLMGAIMAYVIWLLRSALGQLPVIGAAMANVAQGTIKTTQLLVRRDDEVGYLVKQINAMTHGLRTAIGSVSAASAALLPTVERVTSVSRTTEQAMTNQQSNVHGVATAMMEMAQTAAEIARNAGSAMECVHDANREAQEGQTVVTNTVVLIDHLAADVQKAATVINELEQNSENIGSIVDVIRNIAEQTNLLALNAAIEAARAGEQGRGFAVVADEVRVLAQRTQTSTQEIQSLIEKLQQTSRNAVAVMDKGQKQAGDSVQQIRTAGERLTAITRAIGKITQLMTQIASASEEQSSVTEQTNAGVIEINTDSSNTLEGARVMRGECETLRRETDELQAIVSKFQLNG